MTAAVTFDVLKGLLENLHVPNRDILALDGLSPLAAEYVAYSIRLGDRTVHVLLARAIRPAEAKKMSESEAKASVLVLERQTERWTKLWPPAAL